MKVGESFEQEIKCQCKCFIGSSADPALVPAVYLADLFVFYYWFYLALYAGHLPVLL